MEDTGYRYTIWPQDDPTVASGAPAGTEVARRTFSWGDYPDPAPTWMRSGEDGDLLMVRIRRSPPTPPSAPTGLRIDPRTPTFSN